MWKSDQCFDEVVICDEEFEFKDDTSFIGCLVVVVVEQEMHNDGILWIKKVHFLYKVCV